MTETTQDLFGDAPDHSQPSVKGRGPKGGKHYVKPRGYVMPPGTGPIGETCGTCKHHVAKLMSKTYHKCGLNRGMWTGGRATDILTRSPACSKWTQIQS
jgi:hypothetical protein